MSELLPYELELNQQWTDLPLPDENMAWEDMRRRLDEEKRRVIPFWWTGCAGWGLLGVLLLGLGWWILRPEKWFTQKDKPKTEQNDSLHKQYSSPEKPVENTQINKIDSSRTNSFEKPDSLQKRNTIDSLNHSMENNEKTQPGYMIDITNGKIQSGNQKPNSSAPSLPVKNKHRPQRDKQNTVVETGKINSKIDTVRVLTTQGNGRDSIQISVSNPVIVNNPPTQKIPSPPAIDTGKKKPFTDFVVDSIAKTKNPVDSVKKNTSKEKEKPKMVYSAGVGVHQQLPVAGQTLVPYSALGRKGSLGDYVPALYFRAEKENKWFVQIGFRYGAPQLTNNLQFSNVTDTISIQKYNTTKTFVRKTFYHQVPLTVNYFIAHNLSIGAGVTWNKFSSAVTSQDIIEHDRFSGADTVRSSGLIQSVRRADSNFVNSFFQASIEAQYKWKRFSFGANYSFGLQPYIRYVLLPGAVPQEAKNKALNIFVRYELWRSKKKKNE